MEYSGGFTFCITTLDMQPSKETKKMIKKVLNPTYNTKPKPTIATPVQQRKAKEAAGALSDSFLWSSAAEGVDFWNSVFDRLIQIARDGVLKEE